MQPPQEYSSPQPRRRVMTSRSTTRTELPATPGRSRGDGDLHAVRAVRLPGAGGAV